MPHAKNLGTIISLFISFILTIKPLVLPPKYTLDFSTPFHLHSLCHYLFLQREPYSSSRSHICSSQGQSDESPDTRIKSCQTYFKLLNDFLLFTKENPHSLRNLQDCMTRCLSVLKPYPCSLLPMLQLQLHWLLHRVSGICQPLLNSAVPFPLPGMVFYHVFIRPCSSRG